MINSIDWNKQREDHTRISANILEMNGCESGATDVSVLSLLASALALFVHQSVYFHVHMPYYIS